MFVSLIKSFLSVHFWVHPYNVTILISLYVFRVQVHICMSKGEAFPNLHGQLNVTGLAFQIFDAPSWFSVCPSFFCSEMLSSVLSGDFS